MSSSPEAHKSGVVPEWVVNEELSGPLVEDLAETCLSKLEGRPWKALTKYVMQDAVGSNAGSRQGLQNMPDESGFIKIYSTRGERGGNQFNVKQFSEDGENARDFLRIGARFLLPRPPIRDEGIYVPSEYAALGFDLDLNDMILRPGGAAKKQFEAFAPNLEGQAERLVKNFKYERASPEAVNSEQLKQIKMLTKGLRTHEELGSKFEQRGGSNYDYKVLKLRSSNDSESLTEIYDFQDAIKYEYRGTRDDIPVVVKCKATFTYGTVESVKHRRDGHGGYISDSGYEAAQVLISELTGVQDKFEKGELVVAPIQTKQSLGWGPSNHGDEL